MRNPYIRKIAANQKFEHNWVRQLCGFEVEGWYHDTVLGAHTLDNRKGNSGVKFQAYTRMGVIDYDSHIRSFLRSVDGSANGFNRIDKIPKKDLLEYNGWDAALEFGLMELQRKELGF
jgi:hypothetical protein